MVHRALVVLLAAWAAVISAIFNLPSLLRLAIAPTQTLNSNSTVTLTENYNHSVAD